jgi:hypothetical protein
MKASKKIPYETLFDKVARAKLPTWIQSTIALCEALTPLVENLVPLAIAGILYNLIAILFGR